MAFGDRRDAYKVKDAHGMNNILIDFSPHRYEAEVYMNCEIDVTEFCNYIDELKKDHPEVTYYHGMVFILAKTVYSRPYLNRFIANRHVYEHKDVSFGFTAKVEFEDEAEECITVIPVKKDDTVLEVGAYIREVVARMRDKNQKTNDVDGLINLIGNLPNLLRIPITGTVKFLDKRGWLPRSMMDDNLYYASGIVTDIGVFKTGAIYHHLSEFGTNSFVAAFGEIKEVKGRKMMELGATLDERIADGFYFCKALKLIEYLFAHPECLMEEAGKKVSIPENER